MSSTELHDWLTTSQTESGTCVVGAKFKSKCSSKAIDKALLAVKNVLCVYPLARALRFPSCRSDPSAAAVPVAFWALAPLHLETSVWQKEFGASYVVWATVRSILDKQDTEALDELAPGDWAQITALVQDLNFDCSLTVFDATLGLEGCAARDLWAAANNRMLSHSS